MISDEKIYEFCKDHYYCDVDEENEERCLWEPFENYDKRTVERYIENDIYALKGFLKRELNNDWDDMQNN